MKKLFLICTFIISIFTTAKADCLRCIPTTSGQNHCWLSHTTCEKQPDGSGGSHCPNGEDCSDPNGCCCQSMSIAPSNHDTGLPTLGNVILIEQPISNTGIAPHLHLYRSLEGHLVLKSDLTGQYSLLGNISSTINNRWWKFELNTSLTSVVLSTIDVQLDANGIYQSHAEGPHASFGI